MTKQNLITIIIFMSIFNAFGQGEKDKTEFKFNDPENKAVFTCNHILGDKKSILYVEHDSEGDWQFLCGQNDHTEDNAKIISLKQAIELDITLNDLYQMPIGVGAQRKAVGKPWTPFKI